MGARGAVGRSFGLHPNLVVQRNKPNNRQYRVISVPIRDGCDPLRGGGAVCGWRGQNQPDQSPFSTDKSVD